VRWCCDPAGSRVVEAYAASAFVDARQRARVFDRLRTWRDDHTAAADNNGGGGGNGNDGVGSPAYVRLACDRFGSYVLEKWFRRYAVQL
jgi:hypothetical protein